MLDVKVEDSIICESVSIEQATTVEYTYEKSPRGVRKYVE